MFGSLSSSLAGENETSSVLKRFGIFLQEFGSVPLTSHGLDEDSDMEVILSDVRCVCVFSKFPDLITETRIILTILLSDGKEFLHVNVRVAKATKMSGYGLNDLIHRSTSVCLDANRVLHDTEKTR